MEAVGLAAGVVGFASLAIQLADSAVKLQEHYRTYREAPTDVQSLIEELQLVSSLLQQVTATNASRQPHGANGMLLEQCMTWCTSIKDTLLSVAEALDAELKLNRRKASVKYVFKKGSVQQWLVQLERAKSTLLLCQHMESAEATHGQIESLVATSNAAFARHDVTNQGIARLNTQSLTAATKLDTLALEFHNAWDLQQRSDLQRDQKLDSLERAVMAISQHLHTSSATKVTYEVDIQAKQLDYTLIRTKVPRSWQYTLRLRLPLALCQTQWEFQMTKAISGWNLSLHFPVILPNNAEIWGLVAWGNLHTIQERLAVNEVSLLSERLDGTTMLHWAAMCRRLDIFHFLVSQGVEALRVNQHGATPLDFVIVRCMRVEDASAISGLLDCYNTHDETEIGISSMESTRRALLFDSERLKETDVLEALMILLWSPLFGCGSTLPQDIIETILKKDSQILTRSSSRGFTLLHFAASQMLKLEDLFISVQPYYKDLATQAIQAGQSTTQSGVAATSDQYMSYWCSPLGHYIQGVWSRCLKTISARPEAWYQILDSALHIWVTLLADTGVDLGAYGETEWLTFQSEREYALQDLARLKPIDVNPALLTRFTSTLLLSHGPEPSDWRFWQVHPGDEFCGEFWRLIDRQISAEEVADYITAVKHNVENIACSLPGSWNHSVMGSSKPIRCLTELTLKVAKLDDDEFGWLSSVLHDEGVSIDEKYSILGLNTWVLADTDNCKDRSWRTLYEFAHEVPSYLDKDGDFFRTEAFPLEPTSQNWMDFALEPQYGCLI